MVVIRWWQRKIGRLLGQLLDWLLLSWLLVG
jgi:hypothetical protein